MGDFLEESNQKEIEKLMKLSASNICMYLQNCRYLHPKDGLQIKVPNSVNVFVFNLTLLTIFIVFTINIECCWQSSNFDLDFFLFKYQLLIRILTQNFDPAAPSILYN